eukprot:6206265-Amphidinium_carterae.1
MLRKEVNTKELAQTGNPQEINQCSIAGNLMKVTLQKLDPEWRFCILFGKSMQIRSNCDGIDTKAKMDQIETLQKNSSIVREAKRNRQSVSMIRKQLSAFMIA